MSSPGNFSINQKGGIVLILLLAVLLLSLGIGVYLINQKTNWFSFAGNSQTSIPEASSIPSSINAEPSSVYENPFETNKDYTNPFEESYENPFNNI